jgi:hypothetical protein
MIPITPLAEISMFASSTQGVLYDILPQVFQYALPSYDDSLANIPLPRLRHAPLNITHVCRLWRNVALSTPRLWSKIRFEIDSKCSSYEMSFRGAREQDIGRKLDWVKAWMERSGAVVPLDLCVSLPALQVLERIVVGAAAEDDDGDNEKPRCGDDVAKVIETFALLVEQRRRWRSVKMDVHLSVLLAMDHASRMSNAIPDSNPLQLLDEMLSSIDFAGVHSLPNSPILKFNLDNLNSAEHLSIRFYAESPYRDAHLPLGIYLNVKNSPRLQSLELRGPWPRVRIAGPYQIVDQPIAPVERMPCLKRVEISSGYHFTFEQVLEFLSAVSHSIEEFVGMLPYTTSETVFPPASEHKHGGLIIFPKLHTLALAPALGAQISGAANACDLFRIMVAPKLDSMQVALPQRTEDAEEVGRAILGFLSRSRPDSVSAGVTEGQGLRNLKLTGTLSGSWLVDALPALSNLRRMELHHSYDSEAAVQAALEELSSSSLPPPPATMTSSLLLCPLLEQASIGGVRLSEDATATFLEVRTRPSSSVRSTPNAIVNASTLRVCTFRHCRFFLQTVGGGSGRGSRRGGGMESLLGRKDVRAALKRGLKIVFA